MNSEFVEPPPETGLWFASLLISLFHIGLIGSFSSAVCCYSVFAARLTAASGFVSSFPFVCQSLHLIFQDFFFVV